MNSEYRKKYELKGVAALLDGKQLNIEPANLDRKERILRWKEGRGKGGQKV